VLPLPSRRRLAVGLLGLALGLALPLAAAPAALGAPAAGPLPADASSFTFDSFTGDYTLGRDPDGMSTLRTVETLIAEFPESDQNHGIVRAIPTRYLGVDLDVTVLSVTDGAGTPLPYTTDTEDGDVLTLQIGDPDAYVHGRHSYVISHEERGVVLDFPDVGDQELYWNTNGTGWAQPFGTVAATVHVPAELVSGLNGMTACYQGAQGSTSSCTLTRTAAADGGADFSASVGPLAPQQNLTVAIGFTPGTFVSPTLPQDSWLTRIAPYMLGAISAALFLGMLLIRLIAWRDAPGRGVIVAQYAPPREHGVLLAAELLGQRKQASAAQLVSLAVNRAARIVESPQSGRDERYWLQPVSDGSGLAPDDDRAFQVLFRPDPEGARESLSLGRDNRVLGDELVALSAWAEGQLRERGLRRLSPRGPAILFRLLSLGALAAAAALTFWAGGHALIVTDAGFRPTAPIFLGLMLVSIVLCVLTWRAARRRKILTRAGAEYREHLLGLREYIRLAEADRLRVLQSPAGAERAGLPPAERIDPRDPTQVVRLYERLLPYAILFGLEREWAQHIGTFYTTAELTPDWYAGTSYALFATEFSAFHHQLSTTGPQATAPAFSSGSGGSSSFGGSSGGGFSGGGGGGGGGGGW